MYMYLINCVTVLATPKLCLQLKEPSWELILYESTGWLVITDQALHVFVATIVSFYCS